MKPDSPIITSAFSDDASSGPSYVTAEGAAASDETAAIVSSSVEDVPVFIVGARVSTAYGRGAVTGLRGAPASPDVYCVQLDFGTAYLAAAAVTARALDDLTFEEIIADTETLRARGNAAFAAKDYDAAILNYHLISGTLALAPRSLTLPQRFAMRESIVKALSNACQARINKGDVESAKSAVRSACDVSGKRGAGAGGVREARDVQAPRRFAPAPSALTLPPPPPPPRPWKLTRQIKLGSAISSFSGAQQR